MILSCPDSWNCRYWLLVSMSKICFFIQSYSHFFDKPLPLFYRSLHQNHHRHKHCYYKPFSIQYIFFGGDKRTSSTGVLIDVPFELDNENNYGFCNRSFTQKVVFFIELWKSPLAFSLNINVTIGIKIK